MQSVRPFPRLFSRRLVGCAAISSAPLAMALAAIATPAAAQTPFNALAGSWSGGGQIRLGDGRTERLSCRANYNPRAGGSSMGMSIRCASPSYRIELRSSLQYAAGGQVSGTWEERSFNQAGTISGRASSGALNMSFSGNINGSLNVSYSGSSQRVSITTGGNGFSSVSLSLSKG
jgi:hypothetical protein